MGSGSQSLRKKLLLALAAPIVFFIAIEGSLRLFRYGNPTTFTLRKTYSGQDYHVANPNFTARFFPKQNPRSPVPFAIPVKKPANGLRVLVLGASAAQGDPKPSFGFSRMLERMLSGQFPERSVEVFNLGITAINSHVVKDIASDCRKLEADYWVIYLGNNEVIGPFGPANPSQSTRGNLLKIRNTLVQSRTGQLLTDLLSVNKKQPLQWKGMEDYLQPIQWDSPELKKVHADFRANLESIVKSGKKSGTEVLLSTVAVNLRTCSPLLPEGPAQNSWKARDFAKARDLDAYRFRADSRTNEIIREVASNDGLRLIDSARRFAMLEPEASEPLFLDHVHFTLAGNSLIASLIVENILDQQERNPRPPSKNPTLGFTRFDRHGILKIMQGRLSRAPFLKQSSNGLSAKRLQPMIERLAPNSTEVLEAIDQKYLEAIEAHPQDPFIRNNYITFLLSHNLTVEARPHCQKALELAPWDPKTHYHMGLVLAGSQNPTNARRHLQDAIVIEPGHHLSHSLLGSLLMDGDPESALEHLYAALRIEPDDVRTLLSLAKLRLYANKLDLRDHKEAYSLALQACAKTKFTNPNALVLFAEATKHSNRRKETRAKLEDAIRATEDPKTKAMLQETLENL